MSTWVFYSNHIKNFYSYKVVPTDVSSLPLIYPYQLITADENSPNWGLFCSTGDFGADYFTLSVEYFAFDFENGTIYLMPKFSYSFCYTLSIPDKKIMKIDSEGNFFRLKKKQNQ